MYYCSSPIYQMFEHSQALHAHQQQRQSHPGHSAHAGGPQPGSTSSSSSHQPSVQRLTVAQESSFNPSASQRVPAYQRQHSAGGAITQQQLVSALAGAMGTVQPSHLSAVDFSTARASRYMYMYAFLVSSLPQLCMYHSKTESVGMGL